MSGCWCGEMLRVLVLGMLVLWVLGMVKLEGLCETLDHIHSMDTDLLVDHCALCGRRSAAG